MVARTERYKLYLAVLMGIGCLQGARAALPVLSTLPSGLCEYKTGFAVLGGAGTFFREIFAPGYETTSPVNGTANQALSEVGKFASCGYIVYHPDFYKIIDANQSLRVVAQRDYAFAHEAPVYLPAYDLLLFVSNRLGDTTGTNQYIDIYTMSLKDGKVTQIPTNLTRAQGPQALLMANGATKAAGSSNTAILVTQGIGPYPGKVVAFDPVTLKTTTLLDNYFGRQFNSPNDVVVHPGGTIWFTDPDYGFYQKFKPKPQLQNYVWMFDPKSGQAMPVAEGFVRPNGLVFSRDHKTLYVTDTGLALGNGSLDTSNPQSVYAFDVQQRGGRFFLENRRLFAASDVGVPDGIKLDEQGNIYTGTAAGVDVYSPEGVLLGRIQLGSVANLAFVGRQLFMLHEKAIVAVSLKVKGLDLV